MSCVYMYRYTKKIFFSAHSCGEGSTCRAVFFPGLRIFIGLELFVKFKILRSSCIPVRYTRFESFVALLHLSNHVLRIYKGFPGWLRATMSY